MGLLGRQVKNERGARKWGASIGLADFEVDEVIAAWSKHYAARGEATDWAVIQRAMIYRLDGMRWKYDTQ